MYTHLVFLFSFDIYWYFLWQKQCLINLLFFRMVMIFFLLSKTVMSLRLVGTSYSDGNKNYILINCLFWLLDLYKQRTTKMKNTEIMRCSYRDWTICFKIACYSHCGEQFDNKSSAVFPIFLWWWRRKLLLLVREIYTLS